jgi:hypothetical protein
VCASLLSFGVCRTGGGESLEQEGKALPDFQVFVVVGQCLGCQPPHEARSRVVKGWSFHLEADTGESNVWGPGIDRPRRTRGDSGE